jgi:hypothetical protein
MGLMASWRILRYNRGIVMGVAYDAISEREAPFQIDVSSGSATGGGYPEWLGTLS